MRRERIRGPASGRLAGWRGWAQLPAVAGGLGLAELALVAQAGPPATQLDLLRHLGDTGADPLACLLALLTLIAEALVAYLFAVLALRSLSMLQGAAGRLAARMMFVVTPVAVRRMLELLVGGSLLAQAAVALPSAQPARPDSPGRVTIVAGWPRTGPLPATGLSDLAAVVPEASTDGRATMAGSAGMRAVQTRPTPRRRSAPLPPWLGGGPSMAAPEPSPATTGPGSPETRGADRGHTVERHDTLWDIAAANLAPQTRSAANVHRYWQQIYRANRSVVGADPHLIHPGTHLDVPPYDRHHR